MIAVLNFAALWQKTMELANSYAFERILNHHLFAGTRRFHLTAIEVGAWLSNYLQLFTWIWLTIHTLTLIRGHKYAVWNELEIISLHLAHIKP